MVVLPPNALAPKSFMPPAIWFSPDLNPADRSEILSSSFAFSNAELASCRAACPSLVAWLMLSDIPATSCEKGAVGLLPGPEDAALSPPNPNAAVSRSLVLRLLATCSAVIPSGSPLARLIRAASSCGVSG